ncbi:MAG: 2'-5' RNA ligase family protein [Clostridium sp.]|nr:2'-5' RNA ligase family protein [Clostridium sp.]
MRYVIVSVIKGEAGEFNNNLRKEVFENFKARSSKLPAHFTIKAPFEYDGNIEKLENILERFTNKEKATSLKINGYDHFDDRVIYMKVDMSEEGKKVHDKLISKLGQLSFINFNKNDGYDKVFHVTITSKKLPPKYQEVWNYVKTRPCKFNCSFDNISVFKWEDNTWKLYKEYLFKKEKEN